MRQALSMALQDFSGALLLVSHDRHLIKSTVDDLYLVAEGRVQEFEGDLRITANGSATTACASCNEHQ